VLPPHLQHGWTAYAWVRYMVITLPVCLVGLVGIPVVARTMHVGAAGKSSLIAVLALIGLVGAAGLAVAAVGIARAIRRERAAGYTTLFDSTKGNLWQPHPKTGEVVRAPGE
jgi:energy-converting hydrogenase Eha subunit H